MIVLRPVDLDPIILWQKLRTFIALLLSAFLTTVGRRLGKMLVRLRCPPGGGVDGRMNRDGVRSDRHRRTHTHAALDHTPGITAGVYLPADPTRDLAATSLPFSSPCRLGHFAHLAALSWSAVTWSLKARIGDIVESQLGSRLMDGGSPNGFVIAVGGVTAVHGPYAPSRSVPCRALRHPSEPTSASGAHSLTIRLIVSGSTKEQRILRRKQRTMSRIETTILPPIPHP